MPLKAAGFFYFHQQLNKERLLPINSRKKFNLRNITSKSLQHTASIADKSLTSIIDANSRLSQKTVRHIPIIQTIQQTNLTLSTLDFSSRRLERSLNALKLSMDTGKQQNALAWLWYWCVDVLLFIWECFYSVLQPIVYLLWVSFVRTVFLIAFNFIFFGGIYLLMIN